MSNFPQINLAGYKRVRLNLSEEFQIWNCSSYDEDGQPAPDAELTPIIVKIVPLTWLPTKYSMRAERLVELDAENTKFSEMISSFAEFFCYCILEWTWKDVEGNVIPTPMDLVRDEFRDKIVDEINFEPVVQLLLQLPMQCVMKIMEKIQGDVEVPLANSPQLKSISDRLAPQRDELPANSAARSSEKELEQADQILRDLNSRRGISSPTP